MTCPHCALTATTDRPDRIVPSLDIGVFVVAIASVYFAC